MIYRRNPRSNEHRSRGKATIGRRGLQTRPTNASGAREAVESAEAAQKRSTVRAETAALAAARAACERQPRTITISELYNELG
jgi:hypothetical protein